MSKTQEPLILPQTLHHSPSSSQPHRKSYIVKSLTVILTLTVVVLVINYYLISNCPKDNGEPENLLRHSSLVPLREIAGEDGVLKAEKVTVSVYYEILCPDSKHFILKQLVPTFNKYSSYLDLRLVPFGKANVVKKDQGYGFTCQHGTEECHGNKLHSCVIQEFPKNQSLQLDIIACSMERFRLWGTTTSQIDDVVKQCRDKYAPASSSSTPVMCSNADELLAKHGYETLALNPRVTFIPTIAVDGSLSNQRQILRDFKTVTCEILRKKEAIQTEC